MGAVVADPRQVEVVAVGVFAAADVFVPVGAGPALPPSAIRGDFGVAAEERLRGG